MQTSLCNQSWGNYHGFEHLAQKSAVRFRGGVYGCLTPGCSVGLALLRLETHREVTWISIGQAVGGKRGQRQELVVKW